MIKLALLLLVAGYAFVGGSGVVNHLEAKGASSVQNVIVVKQYAELDPAMIDGACMMFPRQVRRTVKGCK